MLEWPKLIDDNINVQKRPAKRFKNTLHDGEWKDDKPYGRGAMVYPNNEIYFGNVQ